MRDGTSDGPFTPLYGWWRLENGYPPASERDQTRAMVVGEYCTSARLYAYNPTLFYCYHGTCCAATSSFEGLHSLSLAKLWVWTSSEGRYGGLVRILQIAFIFS